MADDHDEDLPVPQADPAAPAATPVTVTLPPGVQLPFPGFPAAVQMQQVQVWQGQFPPPEAMERYVALQPDAFDRIIRMAERAQDATIDTSRRAMDLQSRDIRRGQWLGTLVTLSAVGGAIFAASIGATAVAIALVGIPVMSVGKALIDSATANRQVKTQAKMIENTPVDQPHEEA